MGGFFGGILKHGTSGKEAEALVVRDVYYGTDYHSHLGTSVGGMSVWTGKDFVTKIQDIALRAFRAELTGFKESAFGRVAIGSISDFEPQPLTFQLKSTQAAIAHVGRMNNLEELVKKINPLHALSTMSHDGVNPIEIIAQIVNSGRSLEDGLELAQNTIQGSCSLMLATPEAIYLSRDRFGRTPVFIGEKKEAYAASLETCSFPNRGFEKVHGLKAGEIGRLSSTGYEILKPGDDKNMQICTFLWVYYGFPASSYEGRNVEEFRNRNGRIHAKSNFDDKVDFVAGFPDSGIGHGLGYAEQLNLPYKRPFAKYSQTWQRSFMPSSQEQRDHVAEMKLIPIPELISGKRILFTEDSIVRGTQLIARTAALKQYGAAEVHMRPSCPPLIFPCIFLNFSMSKGPYDLAGRRAIRDLEGKEDLSDEEVRAYSEEDSVKYTRMVEKIRSSIPNLTTLDYQRLYNLNFAVDLPKNSICTHCWDGSSYCNGCPKKF